MNTDSSSFDNNLRSTPNQGDEFAQDELEALSTLEPEQQSADVYLGWNSEEPAEFDGLGTIDDNYVYGLDMNNPAADSDVRNPQLRILMPLIAVAAVLVIGAIAGFAVWRLGSHKSEQTTVVQKKQKEEPKAEEKPEEEPVYTVYTANDIKDLVSKSLFYDGGDVSLELSQVGVGIRGGKVMVVHQLASGTAIAPTTAVRLAGIRANVLASLLTGTKVKGEDNIDTEFSELVWVLRNEVGVTYIAVTELPGAQRASDETYGILLGSKGYVISESLHTALGDDAGVPISKGDNPTDLEGKKIEAKAELPQEEKPAEVQETPVQLEANDNYVEEQAEQPANNTRRPSNSNNNSSNSNNNNSNNNQDNSDQGNTSEEPSDSGDTGDTGDDGSDSGEEPETEQPSTDSEEE